MNIDFKDSQEMDEIERMVWTEALGALYIDNHGVFKDVRIDFKYLGQRMFQVKLNGSAEPGTPFEVSADVRLLIELKAYDNRSTKEDILNFFEKIFHSEEFNQEWRYRDEDIFFTATPKD
ncbi:MAG TPA: hypothetical protein VJ304_09500 [Flavobacterium sp.]|nr:hypothetical protein [Flavobacterium sp.]